MSSSATLTPRSLFAASGPDPTRQQVIALVVVWAPHEPSRLAEVLLPAPHPEHAGWLFGRGEPQADAPWRRLTFLRQRPGDTGNTGYPTTPTLSRRQLEIRVPDDETLSIRNVGRCPLLLNGLEVTEARVRPGDLLELRDQLMFVCQRRPGRAPAFPDIPLDPHPFGEPDADGLVGEGPALWHIRQEVARIALHDEHVLLLGASGTGKELAAQAIHRRSSRGSRPLISRNAATFPDTLIDAELFGNAKGFPNPGMAERPGLIGQAHGSTLFLDEIGELSTELQARLLRVLDAGEYQRLGDATVRRSSFRLIAATNRAADSLKHDMRARLLLSLELPGLADRREDIPLLVRSILRRLAGRNTYIAQRFFDQGDAGREARISSMLVRRLLQWPFTTHVRELERLLLEAISSGSGRDYVDCPASMLAPDVGPWAGEPAQDAVHQPGHQGPDAARTPGGQTQHADDRPGRQTQVEGDRPGPQASSTNTAPQRVSPFTDEELRRLERFRALGFRIEAYAGHPDINRTRSTANVHLLALLFKALCACDFRIDAAAALLAAEATFHRPALRRRLEQHLEALSQALADEGEAALKARLRQRYRAESEWFERGVDALRDGVIRSA